MHIQLHVQRQLQVRIIYIYVLYFIYYDITFIDIDGVAVLDTVAKSGLRDSMCIYIVNISCLIKNFIIGDKNAFDDNLMYEDSSDGYCIDVLDKVEHNEMCKSMLY